MIEDQAMYKFLCYSGELEDAKDALLVTHSHPPVLASLTLPPTQLWVFTPDLICSTSDDREPRRCMKIFYRTVSDPASKSDTMSDSKVEELQLPQYVIRQLLLDLKVSTNILPQSARAHQNWTIGLLER